MQKRRPPRNRPQAPESATRKQALLQAFEKLWAELFSKPIHLDSALAKQSKSYKSILAQIIPVILLRPTSTAEAYGVGIPSGEPWSLEPAKLQRWRAARQMAERIYESMSGGLTEAAPTLEDFPPRMIEEWKSSFGDEAAQELARVLAQEPPLSLRASKSVGAKALLKALKSSHDLPVHAETSDLVPFGVRLAGYAPILSSKAYEEGSFEIQDEGSQLMALLALWPELYGELLQEVPGPNRKPKSVPVPPSKPPVLTVIDACAGAGGKSLALADALGGRGRVFSYDTSETKLQALRRRATRAGLRNIQALAMKEGSEQEKIGSFAGTADVVLVDAPCSGWGVLRRNPDIKWRQAPDVLERMPQIQARLLSLYSGLVKPGGRLVYGVCTFRKAETGEIVQDFLSKHPEFKAGPGGYFGPGPTDGFFMQVFTR